MNRDTINITIVEDNEIYRLGLAMMIDSIDKYHIVSQYDSCEMALRKLHLDIPDIVLMDINLPGMNGIEGIRRIKRLMPRIEIIVNTIHEESELVFDALKAGATGYITKGSDRLTLIQALDEVLNGGAPMSTSIASKVVRSFQRNPISPLSPRETEVLALLAEGRTYQWIGNKLGVTLETIKSHVKRIYSKLHANNKDEALEIAKESKLI